MKRSLVLLLTIFITNSVSAEDQGTYLGVSYSHIFFNGEENIALGAATTTDTDDNSNGWRVYGGYNFNKKWAVEAAYWDLGETKFNNLGTNTTTDVDVYTAHVVRKFSLQNKFERLTPFVRAGFAYLDHGSEVNNAVGGSGATATLGAGIKYAFDNGIDIRAEYDYLFDVDNIEANILSIGLQYNF